jgi:hypothetical protein
MMLQNQDELEEPNKAIILKGFSPNQKNIKKK